VHRRAYFRDILKIFIPLKNEPSLEVNDIHRIIQQKQKEKEFWDEFKTT
jgi:hypothetical protein